MDLINEVLSSPDEWTWSTMQCFGFPLWVKEHATLLKMAENIAKAEYIRKRDPNMCALYYVALKRNAVLAKLYDSAKTENTQNEKIANLLTSDFTIAKYKEAALSNAYKLKGLHRYELSLTFFLLAGELRSAINVCLMSMRNWQLAIFLARVVDKPDSPIFYDILKETVIPIAQKQKDQGLIMFVECLLRGSSAWKGREKNKD